MTKEPAGGSRQVLATDLDGTLIPLDGNDRNPSDLRTLARELASNIIPLIFVTGRHFESVLSAIEQFRLPQPDWVICDVGTSILRRRASGEFAGIEDYQHHQASIIKPLPILELRRQLQPLAGLRVQEEAKQGPFKLSFYTDAARLAELCGNVRHELKRISAPYEVISSVDPFNGDGLIDVLPRSISKGYALRWWTEHANWSTDAILFAGDSGNDLAALTAGYRSVLVGNADRQLARRVHQAHRASGWSDRLYLARDSATSGVLEGCRWFGLLEASDANESIERLGATPVSYRTTHFRVWAPRRERVAVELLGPKKKTRHALARQENGYFSGRVVTPGSGAQYRYVLDGGTKRPDPASRCQPDGVHGASRVVDPRAFPWTDHAWPGVPKRELIIYELHVGAFTQDGTFRAAIERLAELVELGATAVELMPVAQAPGRWNWGYDGVDLFAVGNNYGEPDDFKAFVDACHELGLAVILDVVYNHVGPEGNYLADFGPYFSRTHHTPWGEAFNFDGRHARQVRRFIVDNSIYWLDEYHLDGLRLDAVHFMQDDSRPTILDEIRAAVSAFDQTARRHVHVIAETNVFDGDLLAERPERAAYDAIWCDCLMHSVYSLALPDLRIAHREYHGASDLVETLRHGYVYAGPKPKRVCKRKDDDRRRAAHQPPHVESLVIALQNHDVVGNHPQGKRIHQLASKAFQRAAAALTLLFPGIPLLFMGEEFAADSPFPFFVDFEDARLRQAVDEGRAREYPQHVWGSAQSPSNTTTFYEAKCPNGAAGDTEMLAWYRDLIALRKRGQAEAWLAGDRLTSGHDAQQDVFWLRFERPAGGRVTVQARLNNTAQPSTETVWTPSSGSLLLSSEPQPTIRDGHILLQRNHAVVSH